MEQIQGGVPNLDLNQTTGWYGGEEGGHIGFSPVAPLTGADAHRLRDLLRGMIEEADLDYMAALIAPNARSFIHITLILFDTKNEQQARNAYEVSKRLVQEAAKAGYGEYRAHLDFMDLAVAQYCELELDERAGGLAGVEAAREAGPPSPRPRRWPAQFRSRSSRARRRGA